MATFQPKAPDTGPHPRREPRYDRPLTLENLEAVFQGCADFMKREVYLHGDRERMVTICYLLGMTRNERLSDYILRPLAQDDALSRVPMDEVFKRLRYGALYNLAALVRETLDQVADDLVAGSCVIFFPGKSQALTVPVVTVVIGEGGSGGALALAVGNRIVMLENAIYSVLSPEGFASILWKDASRADEAAGVMKLTADDLLHLGVVDQVIPEPEGGAHVDPRPVYTAVDKAISRHLSQLNREKDLAAHRYQKFRAMGAVREEKET